MSGSRYTVVVATILLVAAAAAAPSVVGSPYWFTIMTTVAINVLLTASLRTVFLIGRISLGHVGFMLVGAYTAALLSIHTGLPMWLSVPAGSLAAALVALLVAYPFLRVAGVYFAILTLLAAETLRLVAYNWKSLTGGQTGLIGIPAPGKASLPGAGAVDFGPVNNYYYLALGVVTVSLLVLYAVERSDLGLKWRSIKDAEPLAQSVGVQVTAYKMVNFTIACLFAGLAGGLYAFAQRGLDAEATSRFGALMSLYLLVYLVIGGESHFLGPVVGATLLTLVAQVAGFAEAYQPILVGVVAIAVTLFMPAGVAGVAFGLWRRWRPHMPGGAVDPRPKETEHARAGNL